MYDLAEFNEKGFLRFLWNKSSFIETSRDSFLNFLLDKISTKDLILKLYH